MQQRTTREEGQAAECVSPYCSRTPYYADGLCRDCHERLMARQFRRGFWAQRVRGGPTAKSMRLSDDAEARW